MRIMYISCINIIIRITAAAAIKFCPALFTFRFCINMRRCKFGFHIKVKSTLVKITHFILFKTNKLMTWINISVRRNSDIFISAATASQTFYCTGSLIKIQHKVKEIKLASMLFIFKYSGGESFIFAEDRR